MIEMLGVTVNSGGIEGADLVLGARKRPEPAKIPDSNDLTELAAHFVTRWQQHSKNFLTVDASRKAGASYKTTATVIFTHGLGDTGDGWAQSFVPMAQALPHVKFIFPTAVERPVTLNNGMWMPAWYNIKGLGARMHEEADGMECSMSLVQSIVHLESLRLADCGGSSRVIVGGFSQGAALSLLAAHAYHEKVAGVIALSGYLTGRAQIDQFWRPENNKTPIFMVHGDSDPIIPWAIAKNGFEEALTLKKEALKDPAHKWKVYEGIGHQSTGEELQDVYEFIWKILPPLSAQGAAESKL